MQKAILVVSFGTSHLEQKAESIDPCISGIRETFKEWDIYESFSSNLIRKKLKERNGLVILSPEEVLEKLKEEGYQKVVIQPLFLIEGIEYDKLIELANHYREYLSIEVGKPLLSQKEDYEMLVTEFESIYKDDTSEFLILGHGSSHEGRHAYSFLQEVLDTTSLRSCVTTLEERGQIHDLPFQGCVLTLIPFMLVAGNHIIEDVLGESEASWMSGLTELGYEVEVVQRGLGSYKSTQNIYINHIKQCLEVYKMEDVL